MLHSHTEKTDKEVGLGETKAESPTKYCFENYAKQF